LTDGGDEFCLLASRKGLWQGAPPEGMSTHTLWTPPHHPWEQWSLPLELAFAPLDILHSPDFIPPFRTRCPVVITVHDLDFLRYPETKSADALHYYRQVGRAVAEAEGVIAVSETTKRDMVELLGVPPERVDVVYHGVSSYYRPLESREEAQTFCGEHGLPETFILWVSTIERRKNLACLLQALAQTDLPPSLQRLVLVGSQGWRAEESLVLIDELGLRERTTLYGPATREELLYLYNAAWVLVYPSFYEGFGLPPLEAMACGTPVISSTTPALREVLGDTPLFCNPNDPASLSQQLERLAQSDDLRCQLRDAGLGHAAGFRWEKAARETLDVYHKAACS
jgi:glycosyltransferase involved in cell wall biosynthesis